MAGMTKWAPLLAGLALGTLAQAQEKWSWAGCPDVTADDFRKVVLVDRTKDPALNEPVKMAIAKDGRVFFAERATGKIKIIKNDGSIVTAVELQVFGQRQTTAGHNNEMGMHGLVLDPGFAANKFIYVFYAPLTGGDIWRISRMVVNGDAIDKASEKVLIEMPAQRRTCCHAGGGMQFDAYGDLWISLGNNTTNPAAAATDGYVKESDPDADDQGHAANTNDLRGKIIRIHPVENPVDGKYYTIPAGNLFPPGQAKTRPEIYVMGLRNAFTIWVDPVKRWVTWGDIGPDNGWDTEEYNLFKAPGNGGWPYFAGAVGNAHYAFRMNKNPAAPTNTSPNNTGLATLPPAKGAFIGYRQAAAVTGPIYQYEGTLKSTTKIPPHFHNKWFVSDFNQNLIRVITLDAAADKVTDNRILFAPGKFINVLQLEVGPQGALYVLEYAGFFSSTSNTRISRMEYTGTCLPETPTGISRPYPASRRGALLAVHPGMRDLALPEGAKGLRLYDMGGREVFSRQGGAGRVALPISLRAGLYRVKYLD